MTIFYIIKFYMDSNSNHIKYAIEDFTEGCFNDTYLRKRYGNYTVVSHYRQEKDAVKECIRLEKGNG